MSHCTYTASSVRTPKGTWQCSQPGQLRLLGSRVSPSPSVMCGLHLPLLGLLPGGEAPASIAQDFSTPQGSPAAPEYREHLLAPTVLWVPLQATLSQLWNKVGF